MAVGQDREIYVVVGDGSYVLMHSELYTAVQEGLKINILVIDNSGWGCIENLQNNNGTPTFGTVFKARNPATGQLDGPNVVVDFAKNGESYGARATTSPLKRNFSLRSRIPRRRIVPASLISRSLLAR
jgi:3D-(3,5/4)-trihydroxycyclohexane-1,2-dione acylhydrolase (decyclizing)